MAFAKSLLYITVSTLIINALQNTFGYPVERSYITAIEIANMKRRDILILVEWCKDKFGKSKFQKSFPKIVVNNKKGPYCGVYFPTENEIHIFPAQNKTFICLCDTIIHEYTHYLQMPTQQDQKDYNRHLKQKGYFDNPFEVNARETAEKYTSFCFKNMKRKGFISR